MHRQAVRIWNVLKPSQKSKIKILLLLTFVSSVLDLISIGLIVPFINAILDPNFLIDFVSRHFQVLIEINEIKLYAFGLFIAFVMFASVLKLYANWIQNKIIYEIGAEISIEVLRRKINQDSTYYLKKNIGENIAEITSKMNVFIANGIKPYITFYSSIVFCSIFVLVLVVIMGFELLVMAIAIIFCYIFVYKIISKKLRENAKVMDQSQVESYNILQEIFSNIRELLIYKNVNKFFKKFSQEELRFRKSTALVTNYSQFPRFIIEIVALITISSLLLFAGLDNQESSIQLFSAMVMFVFAIQKLMPIVQLIYSSYAALKGSVFTINDIINTLYEEEKHFLIERESRNSPLKFESAFIGHESIILKNINLTINRGEKIVLIGESGKGKSSLFDIIMGINNLKEGKITIGFNNITYVPQNVYITNETIKQNILFGAKEYNEKWLLEVVEITKLKRFITEKDEGLEFMLSEKGGNISGGQRQRIGIARAIYRSPDLLLLDESTSALDSTTAKEIINDLVEKFPDTTIIAITHNLVDFEKFDRCLKIDNMGIQEYAYINSPY